MAVAEPYTMLLASLPHLPAPGSVKQLPISRLQLKNRLKWLAPEDQRRLHAMDIALHWAHLSVDLDDAQMLQRAQGALEQIGSAFLFPLVLERLEMRTFAAALRRRRRNQPPRPDEPWGVGRFVRQIETHFHEPAFGLGHLYPWIAQAHQHLQDNEPMALENLLIMESWKQLNRVDDRHGFGFDAVALYTLRWEILHRYIHRDTEKALAHFDTLVSHALDASPVSLEALT
ncbi:hypothetical protein [Geoalkalibacter halelectricus]|uniref:hypothetical protein n=1 Tax=Geoalkalibacter halelectricus TaxID=2847045 RepID=UPI003D1F7D20